MFGMRTINEIIATVEKSALIPVPLVVVSAWNAIAGDTLSQQVIPVGYQDGVLTLAASSRHWANATRETAVILLPRLQQCCEKHKIREIAVLLDINRKPSEEFKSENKTNPRSFELSSSEITEIKALTATLEPPTLRASVRRFLMGQARLENYRKGLIKPEID